MFKIIKYLLVLLLFSLVISACESNENDEMDDYDSNALASNRYNLRHFYYITDPASLYLMYGDALGDALFGSSYPQSYAGNAIRTEDGRWIMAPGADDILPKPLSLHVYFDDNLSNNQDIKTSGTNFYDTEDLSDYSFIELIEGTDFTFDYDSGLLYINRIVAKRHIVAVIYEQNDGVQMGNYSLAEDRLFVKVLKRADQTLEEDPEYWKLEARNIYRIEENIQNEGFQMYIFDGSASDGTHTLICPSDIGAGYTETYNDYLRLDTNGDGLVNGDDQTVALDSGFITFAFLEPFSALGDAIIYEIDPVSVLPDYMIMNIFIRWKCSSE
jgi:hypothetical protein